MNGRAKYDYTKAQLDEFIVLPRSTGGRTLREQHLHTKSYPVLDDDPKAAASWGSPYRKPFILYID